MPAPSDNATPRHVLTPSSLNRLVRDLLGDALPQVWIEGELSNVAKPASGHLYFTLKDSGAQVRCAMFKLKASALRFRPVDGMQVLLRAKVGLYEPRGEFQLVAEYMEPAGEGALQREFEQLKARLDAEGLFDPARKRALPAYARRIGVITSATGAAVRDVLSVLARRWPLADVEILPVPVQGREAPPAIVAMLRKASASARYDVLLLTRGGGSLEDLWAFNDEAVARAVHASAVPVVSAVGHEIDFSIADFVADLRAPTPSAAAELLVPDAVAVGHHLRQLQQRLATLEQRRLQANAQRVDHLLARCRRSDRRRGYNAIANGWSICNTASPPCCASKANCATRGWSGCMGDCWRSIRARTCRCWRAGWSNRINVCAARSRTSSNAGRRRCAMPAMRCTRSARWPRSSVATRSCSMRTARCCARRRASRWTRACAHVLPMANCRCESTRADLHGN